VHGESASVVASDVNKEDVLEVAATDDQCGSPEEGNDGDGETSRLDRESEPAPAALGHRDPSTGYAPAV